jgi:hypothetical protein
MPDYSAFVTLVDDKRGWGPIYPSGRYVGTLKHLCWLWGEYKPLSNLYGVPKEMHFVRHTDEREGDTVVLTAREMRRVARGTYTEEEAFADHPADTAALYQMILDNETERRIQKKQTQCLPNRRGW